ncbi:hypothetical protein NPIL_497561 [Nephila pilipes]|uniref:Uncharacterized protein n=1 Tax=Nephila pilipes TaxID=299642 RepID=A0A8X6PB18_NEPPI|nr:hypothetical protein NPIL_288071 [Nephila pilipes]GFT29459.1 hypothetical protein NPIL_272991 [Nephila pilipes]GFT61170.1 hypothetical protein NPIL_574241 [Nephila pilipes]GFU41462.1 hypothetical protein NPIL_497561 [Nephila pilipes]
MLVWTRIAAEIVDELAIDDLDINVKKPDFFPTLVKMNPDQKYDLLKRIRRLLFKTASIPTITVVRSSLTIRARPRDFLRHCFVKPINCSHQPPHQAASEKIDFYFMSLAA